MASRAQVIEHSDTSYEGDYAAWIDEQARLLEAGQLGQLDRANIAEELRDLGQSEQRALSSAIEIVLLHMAKWDAQPERRGASWATSIANQRDHAVEDLLRSPSFRSRLPQTIATAWRRARRTAASETQLPKQRFAETCPYSWDDIMHRPFDWPEDNA